MLSKVYVSGIGVATKYGTDINNHYKNFYNDVINNQHTVNNIDIPIPNNMTKSAVLLISAIEDLKKYVSIPKHTTLIIGAASPNTNEFEKIHNTQNGEFTTKQIFKTINNTNTCLLANYFGFNSRTVEISTACATSLSAVELGYHLIHNNVTDYVLCGGVEENPTYQNKVFKKLHILAKAYPKPFEANRDGTQAEEGAGVMLLSKYRLNALAEIHKVNTTTSCNLGFSDSDSISECMDKAIKYLPDVILTHSTGTALGDKSEYEAIQQLGLDNVKLYALKKYLGHTNAACGIIEFATMYKCIKNKLPNIFNTEYIDNSFNKDLFKPINTPIKYLLQNSIGLGGINVSVQYQLF